MFVCKNVLICHIKMCKLPKKNSEFADDSVIVTESDNW